jgi:hypothetical protein
MSIERTNAPTLAQVTRLGATLGSLSREGMLVSRARADLNMRCSSANLLW